MKRLFIIIIFFFSCYAIAQWKEEKIITFNKTVLTDFQVHHLSSKGLVLVSEKNTGKTKYSLTNIYNQTNKIIYETTSEKSYTFFDTNDDYVIIRCLDDNRWIVKIYDIINNELITIEDPNGHVVRADVIDKNNILYQYRPLDESNASIYLFDRQKDEKKYILDGLGVWCAPNGKYFIVNTPNEEERYIYYIIYSKDGREILRLPSDINHIHWSPDSKNLLFTNGASCNNFGIISLEDNKTLSLKNIKNFSYFTSKSGDLNCIASPIWGNTKDSIFFRKTKDDGHDILESSIWLFTKKDQKIKQISKTYFSNEHIQDFKVTDKNEILLLTKSKSEIQSVYRLLPLK